MHRLLLALSAACLVAACACPALVFRVYADNPAQYRLDTDRGMALLALGWFGLFFGQFAWLANPVWIAGAVNLLRHRVPVARILFGVALGLSLLTLTLYRKPVPRDEGGVMKGLLHAPVIGFYLWVASMGLGFAASLVQDSVRD